MTGGFDRGGLPPRLEVSEPGKAAFRELGFDADRLRSALEGETASSVARALGVNLGVNLVVGEDDEGG